MTVESDKRVKRLLMCGDEAQKPDNILRMFEAIKGRKATAEEKAEFERVRPGAPDTRGVG
jgi:hypothetical protein